MCVLRIRKFGTYANWIGCCRVIYRASVPLWGFEDFVDYLLRQFVLDLGCRYVGTVTDKVRSLQLLMHVCGSGAAK